VIDSIDWLHDMLETSVCADKGWDSIEAPGYGKGYKELIPPWRSFLAKLEGLRLKLNVLFLGHVTIKKFSNPDGDDYDRFILKIYEPNGSAVQEWVKHVFFAEFETSTFKASKFGKAKGVMTGRRVLHTEARAAFEAKNRWSLPKVLPLSYEAVDRARRTSEGDAEGLFAELVQLVDDEEKKKIEGWLARQPIRKVAIAQAIAQLKNKEAA